MVGRGVRASSTRRAVQSRDVKVRGIEITGGAVATRIAAGLARVGSGIPARAHQTKDTLRISVESCWTGSADRSCRTGDRALSARRAFRLPRVRRVVPSGAVLASGWIADVVHRLPRGTHDARTRASGIGYRTVIAGRTPGLTVLGGKRAKGAIIALR